MSLNGLQSLKELRQNKSVTQKDAANKLNMPSSTYASKEQRGDFSEDEVLKLSTLLKTSKQEIEKLLASQDPVTDDYEGFVMSNQVRGMALLQTILEANAEILARLRDASATSILSDLLKMASHKEEALRKELKKSI